MRATEVFGPMLLIATLSMAAAQVPQDVKGELPKVTSWSGVVRLTGDVTVPEGGRLEIAGGTRILVAARDGLQAGWDKEIVELQVRGQLLVQGSIEQPVLMAAEEAIAATTAQSTAWEGSQATWHGITLFPGADDVQNRDHLRGLQLEGAIAGVQVPNSSPLIEDCVFRNCVMGVEVGTWQRGRQLISLERCGPAGPEIRRCRFVSSHTGVCVGNRGVPVIEQCVMHGLTYGVATTRPGMSMYLYEPGPNVAHCLFSSCAFGVSGCALVRDSIFVQCRTALRLSIAHDRDGVGIEHMVSENCLVYDCSAEIEGDTAVARDVLRGEPKLRGPIEDLFKPWPPLLPCLDLQEGSAALGAARDGSDLGPVIGQRQPSAAAELGWTGKPLLGFCAAATDAPGGWQKVAQAVPGAPAGKSWWARADQEADGTLRLRRTFGLRRTTGLLAIEFDVAAAGQLELQFSADAQKLEIAVNGAAVVNATQRQRFGTASAPVPVKVRAGSNVLLVHIVGWGVDPHLGIALTGDWQPKAIVAEPVGAVTASGRSARGKDGMFVEATVTGVTHWTAAPGAVLAQVKPVGRLQDPVAIDAVWTAPGKLRLGPLPADCSKGEVEIKLPGLRDLLGAPLEVGPFVVKM